MSENNGQFMIISKLKTTFVIPTTLKINMN